MIFEFVTAVTMLSNLDRRIRGVDEKVGQARRETKRIDDYLRGPGFDQELSAVVTDTSKVLSRLRRVGVVDGDEQLDLADLAHRMRGAHSIRILSNWVGGLNELGETLVQAAAHHCDVRILILRHDSEFARTRSLELSRGVDGGFVSNQISSEILHFSHIFTKHPEMKQRILVKAYDASPMFCLFAYDKVRLIGFFWRGELVMNTPFLKVHGDLPAAQDRLRERGGTERANGKTAMTHRIDQHFESLWHDPATKFIRVANRAPDYIDSPEGAWTQDPMAGPSDRHPPPPVRAL